MSISVLRWDLREPRPQNPLAFILYEHLKHREMCAALDALAGARAFEEAKAASLAEFICNDLTRHVADEEEVLFPILRQRCDPEDAIDQVLARLSQEHAAGMGLSAEVRTALLTVVTERCSPADIPGAAAALTAFAQAQRRHMMLEDAVLIPIARLRLEASDLVLLSRRFSERSQSDHPHFE